MKTLSYYLSLLLSMLVLSFSSWGQAAKLLKTISLNKPQLMSTDELGNVYVILQNNRLLRYNINGDSTGFFNQVTQGKIGYIDATNPLRILLFYPQFGKVVLLDNMLSIKNELDLRKLELFNTQAIATSVDGAVWVFDPMSSSIKKLGMQNNVLFQSNDLRLEFGSVIHPIQIVEKAGTLYVSDSTQGLLPFNRYAVLLNTIPLIGIKNFQIVGDYIVYRKGNEMHAYHQKNFATQTIALPVSEPVLDARIERERLYILCADRLLIYQIAF